MCSPNARNGVFNSNVPIFHSDCIDGSHLSASFIVIVQTVKDHLIYIGVIAWQPSVEPNQLGRLSGSVIN